MKIHVKYIFIIVLFFKIFLTGYLSYLDNCQNPELRVGHLLASRTGDTFSYTGAMENYIQTGEYFFLNKNQEKVYAGRLPHYAVPYFVFRQIFSVPTSLDLMVIIAVLLEAVSIWLILLLFRKNKLVFYSAAALFILNLYHTGFNYKISPESLSISLLVISVSLLLHYKKQKKDLYFIMSGCLLVLLTFMKPYFASLVIFWVAYSLKLFSGRFIFINIIPATLLGIFLLTPWVVRNYYTLDKLIITQEDIYAGYGYDEANLAFKSFVKAWGGDPTFWEPSAVGCYFMPSKNIECKFEWPSYAFAKGYSKSDLESVRLLFIKQQKEKSDSLTLAVSNKFETLTNIYKNERPWQYYVWSRVRTLENFLVHKGTYFLPISANFNCFHFFQMGIKLMQAAIYWGALIFGFIASFFFCIKKRKVQFFIIFLPVIYLIFLFPIFLGAQEWRYFHPAIILLLLGMLYVIDSKIDQKPISQ